MGAGYVHMHKITVSERKVILFAMQLIILIVCIAYLYFVYYTDISPNHQVKGTYEQTTCKIDDATLETKGTFIKRYRAVFLVTYVAQGAHYERVAASGKGLDHSFSTDKSTALDLLSKFAAGSTHVCWYNPTDPQIVVLAIKSIGSSAMSLVILFIIAMMMIYYVIRSMTEFGSLVKTKLQQFRNEKNPPR